MPFTSNITVGVATFNRINYIKKMAESLQVSVDCKKLHIRVYDDNSSEINQHDLWKILPFATEIVVRESNLKADMNMYRMYKDFLNTDDYIFFNADSDLIFRPDWLAMVKKYLPQTDGVLSLYHSNKHDFIQPPVNGLGFKNSLGAAGVVMTREIVDIIINDIPKENVKGFDWQWSSILQKKGIRLACLENSYVQHIGIQGQNNKGMLHDFDYGLNFLPVNEVNQQVVMEFIDEMIVENAKIFVKLSENEKLFLDFISGSKHLNYKVGQAVLVIPRKIKKYFHFSE